MKRKIGKSFVTFFSAVLTMARTWVEQIDWVYHAKDTLLTTAQVQANVANYRSQRIMRLNTEF